MTTPFVRDRFTWLGYLMLAFYAYMQATPGPLMPFLREELDLSYTTGGLHFSAYALGMILAGISADLWAQRFGRGRVFWAGGGGMVIAAIFFILGQTPEMTILAVFAMGYIGSLLLVMIQSTLSDYHRENRAIPLTESNIIASVGAACAPFLVGTLQSAGIGWRAALVIGGIFWLGMFFFLRAPVPEMRESETKLAGKRDPLPALFWAYWLVVLLGVSIEWSMIYWGSDFLENTVGLSTVNASTAMSVFFVANVIGRAAGSRLTRTTLPGNLLLVAAVIAFVGFIPFWLVNVPIPALVGLFVVGLGVANLFPLTLTLASSLVTPEQADAASGRISMAAGIAMLITPQLLGSLADQTSIKTAYGIVILLMIGTLAVIYSANRQAYRVQLAQVN